MAAFPHRIISAVAKRITANPERCGDMCVIASIVAKPTDRSIYEKSRKAPKRDLPGSQAIRPVPMPRSPTAAEPTIPRHSRGIVVAAPALPTAKASALDEFRGSITRLQHPLPTLHEWCCHHPCKACFRLAGSPLPGESRTLWIATKGFRSSSSSSGLGLAQGKFHFVLHHCNSHNGLRCLPALNGATCRLGNFPECLTGHAHARSRR